MITKYSLLSRALHKASIVLLLTSRRETGVTFPECHSHWCTLFINFSGLTLFCDIAESGETLSDGEFLYHFMYRFSAIFFTVVHSERERDQCWKQPLAQWPKGPNFCLGPPEICKFILLTVGSEWGLNC